MLPVKYYVFKKVVKCKVGEVLDDPIFVVRWKYSVDPVIISSDSIL